jgi:hypothetical protein
MRELCSVERPDRLRCLFSCGSARLWLACFHSCEVGLSKSIARLLDDGETGSQLFKTGVTRFDLVDK